MAAGKAQPFTHMVRRFPSEGAQYCGESVETGQGVNLKGAPNDAKLLSYGYFSEWPKGVEGYECGRCGKVFAEERFRIQHGNKHHRPAPSFDHIGDPDDRQRAVEAWERNRDSQVENEERLMDQTTPYLVGDAVAAAR